MRGNMDESEQPESVDMASVGERVKSRLDDLEMSVQQLADAVGMTFQNIHLLIRDPQRGLHSENAAKIAQVLKVNERWLVMGLGPKLRTDARNDEEVELLDNFRQLSPELQKALILMAVGMKKK